MRCINKELAKYVSRCLGMIIHKEGFISLHRIHQRKHQLILSVFKIRFLSLKFSLCTTLYSISND